MVMSANFSRGTGRAAPASLKRHRVWEAGARQRHLATSSCTSRRSREMRQMDALYDMDMIRRSCAEEAVPTGLAEVFDEFHRQHVSYCYWKSSRRIHDVLAGAGDVDLLVERADQHRVQVILTERDFKLFPSVA